VPTQRFCNLPEEKRTRITEAAIGEFSDKGIDGADVAGVVRRAGIPRGSFYQYFEGMDDLLGYVFDQLTRAKLRFVAPALEQAGKIPFVDYVELTWRASLRFAESNPKLYTLGRQIYSSTNPVVVRFVNAAKRMGVEHYAPLIDQDKAKGLVRGSIDSYVLAAFVMTIFTEAVGTMLLGYRGGDEAAATEASISRICSTLVSVLRHGIQTKEGAR